MHYSLQLEAIVTHAVSQLSYRWLPLPSSNSSLAWKGLPQDAEHERVDPSALGLRDWILYIQLRRACPGAAAWSEASDRLQLSSIGLATVIYDNLIHLHSQGAVLVDYFHPSYPFLLKHIPDPPACLTCIGDLSLLAQPKLSLVGSRKASDFAFQEARKLAQALVQKGAVVVSGGAVGCDAAVHLGALESALRPVPTIVVLAGGLHRFYPACLDSLFGRLKGGSALFVSERLWEYPARPMDFPVRNRIIAGLSPALLLMQAAARSGALKTASYAIEQGRDVYVLVHESDDIRAEGSRQLLDEGALPFRSAEDFLRLVPMY